MMVNSTESEKWLGRKDSNLGMAESKSASLPLADAPTFIAKECNTVEITQDFGRRKGDLMAQEYLLVPCTFFKFIFFCISGLLASPRMLRLPRARGPNSIRP